MDRNSENLSSRIGVVFQSTLSKGSDKLRAAWYVGYDHLGRGTESIEYVPILHYSGEQTLPFLDRRPPELKTPDGLRAYVTENHERFPPGTTWLIGNEVGFAPNGDTRSPHQYARDYHDAYEALKSLDMDYLVAPTSIVTTPRKETSDGYSPVTGYPSIYFQALDRSREILELIRSGRICEHAVAYLEQVMEKYRKQFAEEMPIDVFNIHPYARNVEEGCTDADDVLEQVAAFRRFMKLRGYRDCPLMISEIGCPLGTPPPDDVAAFLTRVLPDLLNLYSETLGPEADDYRLVQRIAWVAGAPPERPEFSPPGINWNQTTLLDSDGNLTPLGQTFNNTVQRLSH